MKTHIKIILLILIMGQIYVNAQSIISLNTANYRSPDIAFHNPAAITSFENYHLMVSTQFLHTGLVDESMQNSLMNFVLPLKTNSALGAQVHYFTSNIFNQGKFSLLYGHQFFGDKLAVGLNANLLTYSYTTENFFLFDFNDPVFRKGTSQNAFSFGISLLARPRPDLVIGVAADHLNSPDIAIGDNALAREKIFSFGVAYLSRLIIPQIDVRMEGQETVTQGSFGKKLFNNKMYLKSGYNFHQNEGNGFFAEVQFLIGDLGVMYNFRNQIGDFSAVAGASHQIGIYYTKGNIVSVPEIILSNIQYDSHLPQLEILGRAVNKTGLDYIEIKNNDVIQEKIDCGRNTISQEIAQTVLLEPGDNEIVVTAFSQETSHRERILVEFEPLPPVIEIQSIQNTQVDKETFEFIADVSDRTDLKQVQIFFNDEPLKTLSSGNVKSENIRIPVKLKAGENKFRVVANNKWKTSDQSSFIVYKSAELPPVLTIDSPQKPVSPSSSVVIDLQLENKKYIEEIVIKVNGEQREVIKIKPTTRGVKSVESAVPVSHDPFSEGKAKRTIDLNKTESIIEAIAYDSNGLPRTSSKVLKILFNPFENELKYARKTAIIIGINQYKSQKISRLDLAVSDAETVKQLLNDYYHFDDIVTLYNEKADFTGIIREVYTRLKNAQTGELIVIYYAGHGITIEDRTGGESGYLLPYDSELETELNTISMTNLNQRAIQSNAKDVLFIIDACYSGLGLVSVPPLSQYPAENIDYENLNNESQKISRNIITAGGKKQEAVDGLFTRFLKSGLQGAADYNRDKYITSNELGYYLKTNVSKEAKRYKMEQTPQFGSIISDHGEVVFRPKKIK